MKSIGPENWYIVEITHDGVFWPFKWSWSVRVFHGIPGSYLHSERLGHRSGDALTRARAESKTVRARLSIEREDTRLTFTA